jgi:hypothetical protein
MHDNKLYSCSNGMVTVFEPFIGTTSTIDLSTVVGSGQGNSALILLAKTCFIANSYTNMLKDPKHIVIDILTSR